MERPRIRHVYRDSGQQTWGALAGVHLSSWVVRNHEATGRHYCEYQGRTELNPVWEDIACLWRDDLKTGEATSRELGILIVDRLPRNRRSR